LVARPADQASAGDGGRQRTPAGNGKLHGNVAITGRSRTGMANESGGASRRQEDAKNGLK